MEYRSPRTLSLIAMFALGGCALLKTIGGLAALFLILAPTTSLRAPGVAIPVLIEGFATILFSFLYIFTAVVFLMWLYRAHKNLEFLRPEHLDFTPGWAVGWWFVPIASLFKAFQAVREVWAESDPDVDPDPDRSFHLMAGLHSAPTYMGVWWAAWLIMLIGSEIESLFVNSPGMTTTDFGGAIFVQSVLTVLAAVLAIVVVKDITSRQEARFVRLGSSSVFSFAPPPPPTFSDEHAAETGRDESLRDSGV